MERIVMGSGLAVRGDTRFEEGARIPRAVARLREDAARLAPKVDPVSGAGSRIDAGDVRGLSALLASLGPEMLAAKLASETRDAQAAAHGETVRGAEARGEVAETERQEAVEQARKAAEKASGLLGLKGPIAKLVKVIAAAVTVAVSVFSGGALGGVAVVGMALLLGAEPLADLAKQLGWVDEEGSQRLQVGLKVTGSIMGAGAGLAQSVGSSAALAGAVRGVAQATKAMRAAAQVTDGAFQVAGSVYDGRHAEALAAAERAEMDAARASDDLADGMEALRSVLDRFGRIAERLRVAMESRDEARLAAVRNLA